MSREELSKLSQDDLLTGFKRQYENTRISHGQFGRDLSALVLFYDQVVEHCKMQGVGGEKRGKGVPTLEQAFHAVGWNYEAARKMKQRYDASMAALPVYAPTPKPLRLSEGEKVKSGDGTEGIVNKVHESAAKVDVVINGCEETVTIPVAELIKVVVSVKKIKTGDLLRDENGAEYKYEGAGKLVPTKTPTLLERKRERELAAIKVKKEREAAKAEEKKRQQELRKAEAARRDLEKIAEKERRKAESEAEKEAARLRKAAAETTKVKKRSNGASAQPAPQKRN